MNNFQRGKIQHVYYHAIIKITKVFQDSLSIVFSYVLQENLQVKQADRTGKQTC